MKFQVTQKITSLLLGLTPIFTTATLIPLSVVTIPLVFNQPVHAQGSGIGGAIFDTSDPKISQQTQTSLVSNSIIPQQTQPPLVISLPEIVKVRVYAAESWQDTGIEVENGDIIKISYVSGKWRGSENAEYTDPTGSRPTETRIGDRECVFNALPHTVGLNALIAKIGEEGKPVNPFKAQSLSGEGTLYLRYNDCDKYISDNDGSVVVRIRIKRSPQRN
jgi:hypothetical protein